MKNINENWELLFWKKNLVDSISIIIWYLKLSMFLNLENSWKEFWKMKFLRIYMVKNNAVTYDIIKILKIAFLKHHYADQPI